MKDSEQNTEPKKNTSNTNQSAKQSTSKITSNKNDASTTVKKNNTTKSSDTKTQKNNGKTKNNTSTKSNNQSAPAKETKQEKVEQTVTVSVTIPSGVSKGSGLSATAVTINDGDTVLDASLKAGIQIDYSGSGATAYIKGINGLKEFDEGPLSGWLVKVDGALINRSAGSYQVKDKQKIEWVYTTDYSK